MTHVVGVKAIVADPSPRPATTSNPRLCSIESTPAETKSSNVRRVGVDGDAGAGNVDCRAETCVELDWISRGSVGELRNPWEVANDLDPCRAPADLLRSDVDEVVLTDRLGESLLQVALLGARKRPASRTAVGREPPS
jgi:hypothetical protein